ncbi:hypothetical protein IMG5_051690 [Ichthyophthirius multifiliis]|uniref:Transmembrane protein n=1 Tax=Ichthyophthirius multifiliis TaxID=5932 RepID=G0QMT8_ICHMU|nr:hypothetical protein IMG5_051690 [Ichthyophthirius multifiliis]EGR33491.1 hypothetical protein IMG5_051690 [Ichthyophthirius multifiliis]|eukprot:XP_004037477.1 hypothetical protein IMG5_051690 [Ichthyophthirius multifiliis]
MMLQDFSLPPCSSFFQKFFIFYKVFHFRIRHFYHRFKVSQFFFRNYDITFILFVFYHTIFYKRFLFNIIFVSFFFFYILLIIYKAYITVNLLIFIFKIELFLQVRILLMIKEMSILKLSLKKFFNIGYTFFIQNLIMDIALTQILNVLLDDSFI